MHTDKMRAAYQQSKTIYDDVLTQQGLFAKLYINVFWGVDDVVIAEEILSWIPDDFSGQLLDVPVGTGVFTEKKYHTLTGKHCWGGLFRYDAGQSQDTIQRDSSC